MEKTVDQLTTAELAAILKDKKKEEKAKLEKERKVYEKNRDADVDILHDEAHVLHNAVRAFKYRVHEVMNNQKMIMDEYGLVKSSSKGGFTLQNTDSTKKVIRKRCTQPKWDARSDKGLALIQKFMTEILMRRNKKMCLMLMGLLEKNNEGDLEYSKVMHLLKYEETFNEKDWVEGFRLLKEGYSSIMKGFGYEFKVMRPDGKMTHLELNFSAV